MRRSRRIAVGVCGFADFLNKHRIRYGSEESIHVARRIGTILQYNTKYESTILAGEKEPYTDCFEPDSRYRHPASFMKRFVENSSSDVSQSEWLGLFARIQAVGLRNATTVVFPPTGKSSAYIGATPGIDPFDYSKRSCRSDAISSAGRTVPWRQQVDIAAVFSQFSDDSVSKTVTFPSGTSVAEIWEFIKYSYAAGLAGITAFVQNETPESSTQ